MKILLVKTALNHNYGQVTPPLGLLYVSAALKAAGYRDIRLLHMDAEKNAQSLLTETLSSWKPDVVAFSAITAEGKSLYESAALAKRLLPGVRTIAGGPHPTGYAAECLSNGLDAVVIGEGEATTVELVRALEAKTSLDSVSGIAFLKGGGPAFTSRRPFIENLDSLPLPDWDLVDFKRYSSFVPHTPFLHNTAYMSLFTSRGCPYRCTYCHNVMGKNFRAHSPERVIAEFRALYARGIRHFELLDDIFNWDRERAAEIMRRLIAEKMDIGIYMCNGVRGDILDEELIDLFARAGVRFMSVAIETASPRLQKAIKKNVNLDKLRRAVDMSVKRGIFTHGFFMLGFPGETYEEALETVRYGCSLNIHTCMIAFTLGYRGTELGDGLEEGRAVTAFNDTGTYSAYSEFVNCSPLSDGQLRALKRGFNTRFYFNPARLWRIVRDFPVKTPSAFALMLKKFITRTLVPK